MRDFDIRILIKNSLLKKYYLDNDSKVVEELDLPAGKARIDLAVINGHLHGFEIKSAQDTLLRLPSQVQAYSQVFDFVSVITEEKYLIKLENVLPQWVGIYCCNSNGVIKKHRKALINRGTQGFYLAKLLWKEELLDILKEHNIKHRKSDRSWLLCETLSQNMDVKLLSQIVRQKLKKRPNWKLKNAI